MKNLSDTYRPLGQKAMLAHGGLPEVVSLHLLRLIKKTGGKDGPIGRQFIACSSLERKFASTHRSDPLNEDHHEVAPGLVYKFRGKVDKKGTVKYYGRALWTVTRFCASYCRFCTRGREVGISPGITTESSASIANKTFLSDSDIYSVSDYIKSHKEINEIIVSGGDCLTTPRVYFEKIIAALVYLQKNGHLDIVRFGTRVPVHNPATVQNWHFELLSQIKNPYLMVHINHEAELTEETLQVLYRFRKKANATVMSQTVFLRGVNDSVDTLYALFTRLAKEGIRPYYLFQNDPVYWAKHFTVSLTRGIKIWEKLRPILSGVCATVRFVVDVPDGYGKIPIPEGRAWDYTHSHYRDFKGKKHKFI